MNELLQINLYRDRQAQDFVQGLNSSAPQVIPALTVGNTYVLALHNLVPSLDRVTLYRAEPWSFTEIRASIGLIDAAPERGTFRLKVGEEITAADLPWPSDVSTPALRAAWKAQVLAALQALPGVGIGGVRLDDPPETADTYTPSNFFYFTWLDDLDEREIEVVNVELTPPVEVVREVQQAAPGFTQVLKIVQLPYRIENAFAFPPAGVASIEPERDGGVAQNEVQILTIPTKGRGAIALTYSGVQTRSLPLSGITLAAVQEALNELVPDGKTNPSFRVTARGANRAAIEFIGPLAKSDQALLAVETFPDLPLVAMGKLQVRGALFTRALNGRKTMAGKLEVTIATVDGEQTILREVTIQAPITRNSTWSSAEGSGAVGTVEHVVYIPEDSGEPIIEAAPGHSFTASAPGDTLVITHNLNTWEPPIAVVLLKVNHTAFAAAVAEDDEEAMWAAVISSRTLRSVEYDYECTSKNQIEVALNFSLSGDPTNPKYYWLLKVRVWGVNNTWKANRHKHNFLTVVEDPNDEDSPTLQDKLDELDAAIAVFGGAVNIDAKKIVGKIKAEQIDLSSLSTALTNISEFATALQNIFENNPDVVNVLGDSLMSNANYIIRLGDQIKNNPTLIESIGESFANNPDWLAKIQEIVWNIIASGGGLPAGMYQTRSLPDVDVVVPMPIDLEGPTERRKIPTKVTTTETIGGKTTTTEKMVDQFEEIETTTRLLGPLSIAFVSSTTGDAKTGELLEAGTGGTVYPVGSGGAWSPADAGRDLTYFAEGVKITYANGHWFEVVEIGANNWFPKEMEIPLFKPVANATQLGNGQRWTINGSPLFLFETDGNPVFGRIEMVVEMATVTESVAGQVEEPASWTVIDSVILQLSASSTKFAVRVVVDKSDAGALSGKLTLIGKQTTFNPLPLPLAIRGRLTKFDAPAVLGALTVSARGMTDAFFTP